MSTTQVTLTTRQPSTTPSPIVELDLVSEVLAHTEAMNNQLLGEMNHTMKTFRTTLEDIQKTLDATIKENHLLKKEIIQLNTTIKENERLHAAEMKKNTQTIATLSQSVSTLTTDLRSTNSQVRTQEKNFEVLVQDYNSHGHRTTIMLGNRGGPAGGTFSSGNPSTPYQTGKN